MKNENLKRQLSVCVTQEQYEVAERLRRKLGYRSVSLLMRTLLEYGVYKDETLMLESELALMRDVEKFSF